MNERATASAALFVACLAFPAAAQPAQPDGSWQNPPKTPATGAAPAPAPVAPTTPAPAPAQAPPTTAAEPVPASVAPTPAVPTVLEEDAGAEPATTSNGAGSMSATASAPANPTKPALPVEDEAPDDGAMGSHRDHWVGTLGVRTNYVTNSGYDAFDSDNALPQLAVGVGRTLASDDRLSLAGLLLWDWGRSEATARGAESALDVHRLTLAAEGRYHLIRRLYVFGRLAPGALHWKANLQDRVADLELADDRWVFAADLSAGAAFEFAGEKRGASKRPRGWVSADGGYGWSAASGVELVPEDANAAPARSQPVALGDLGLRGGFFRVALGLTY
jgi:hypothetical protein